MSQNKLPPTIHLPAVQRDCCPSQGGTWGRQWHLMYPKNRVRSKRGNGLLAGLTGRRQTLGSLGTPGISVYSEELEGLPHSTSSCHTHQPSWPIPLQSLLSNTFLHQPRLLLQDITEASHSSCQCLPLHFTLDRVAAQE